ncbi:MAG: hypothetical protein IKG58_00885 [Bacilli bacterium]|nr:hypothetical protein [Bacilli bacterium]
MDLKQRRKEIRKKKFPISGLLIITFLGMAGIVFLILSGIFQVKTLNDLYQCILKNGVIIVVGTLFLFMFLLSWVLFFLNIILKPKRKVLYLCRDKHNKLVFLDKKGRKTPYNGSEIEENKHYYVLKTTNYIFEVVEPTNEGWIPKEKESYWLNWYSPVGNINGILILPVFYAILLITIFYLNEISPQQKIRGLMAVSVPLYVILYDLIYKIKLRKSNSDKINDTKFLLPYDKFLELLGMIEISFLLSQLIVAFIEMPNLVIRIVLFIFILIVVFIIYKRYIKDKLH